MKITIDTQYPSKVMVAVGNKKTSYADLSYADQKHICVVLESARLHCSMTLKPKREGVEPINGEVGDGK